MITRRTFTIRAAVMAASLTAVPRIAGADGPINIGAFLSVTGPASFLGAPELKALQLEIDSINAAGGVLGRKLALKHYDDGGNAGQAVQFARRMIDQDQVVAIVGGTVTPTTMAVAAIANRARIPFVSVAGSIKIVEPVTPYVFKTPPTDKLAVQRLLEDLKARGLTKVAMLSSTDGFGQSARAQALEQAGNYGVQILADESFGPDDKDVTAQLANIKAKPGLQAVLVMSFGNPAVVATKNYRQVGLTVPQYHTHSVAADTYLELSGDAAEGVRISLPPVLVADQLPDDSPIKKPAQAFAAAYKKAYNENVSAFAGWARDALHLVVQAIQRAGTVDGPKVRDALESTTKYPGTSGLVTMSPQDHQGLSTDALVMVEVRNGTWKIIQ